MPILVFMKSSVAIGSDRAAQASLSRLHCQAAAPAGAALKALGTISRDHRSLPPVAFRAIRRTWVAQGTTGGFCRDFGP
jgi:hypothetical protein